MTAHNRRMAELAQLQRRLLREMAAYELATFKTTADGRQRKIARRHKAKVRG